MGRFMLPCCCICGRTSRAWPTQDFCPEHQKKLERQHGNLEQYLIGFQLNQLPKTLFTLEDK
jgi:hypothetical protein